MPSVPETPGYRYPFARERALYLALVAGNRAQAERALNSLFAAMRRNCATLNTLKSDAIHLTVVLIRKCYQSGAVPESTMGVVSHHTLSILQSQSVEQIEGVLREVTEGLLAAVGEQRPRAPRQHVDRALRYIHAHFHNGVSLREVASAVGLSYSYFSRLFAQEVGESFHCYLTRVRLDAARELLVQTPMTVEEVATCVGYEDVSHFIRLFKRFYQSTPRQYALLCGGSREGVTQEQVEMLTAGV